MRASPVVLGSPGLALAAFVLLAARATAQRVGIAPESATLAGTIRAVTAVDSALAVAEARGDTAAMRPFFAAAYYSVAPDGEMLGPRARLYRIARGRKVSDSAQTLTAPWVRALGPDAVIVTRSTRISGLRHAAEVAGSALRVTRLYVREAGTWRLIFQQGSPLADEHVAGSGPGAPPRFPPD